MKTILIGLLLAAIATGAYFILRNGKKTDRPLSGIQQEQINGTWVTGDSPTGDTLFSHYRYVFEKDGLLIRQPNDSTLADTLYYSWGSGNGLTWKKNKTDSTGSVYRVQQWRTDTLLLLGADSSKILFTRVK